jgi:hypothetical protein
MGYTYKVICTNCDYKDSINYGDGFSGTSRVYYGRKGFVERFAYYNKPFTAKPKTLEELILKENQDGLIKCPVCKLKTLKLEFWLLWD